MAPFRDGTPTLEELEEEERRLKREYPMTRNCSRLTFKTYFPIHKID